MKKIAIIVTMALAAMLLVPLALYLGLLFLAHDCNPDFLKIDSCLDAGGRWDYENRVPIFEEDMTPDNGRNVKSNITLHGTQ